MFLGRQSLQLVILLAMFEIVCLCLHAIYVYSTYSICSFFKLNQAVLVGLAVWLLSSTPKYASIMYILFPCTFFYRVLLLWMFFYCLLFCDFVPSVTIRCVSVSCLDSDRPIKYTNKPNIRSMSCVCV